MILKKTKDKKGITLIALVITIIVLLILAGVSIATLTGENGILTQAQSAKNKTEESEDIEKIRLAISEAQMGEDGYQELTTENLGSALIKDGVKSIVSDNEDGTRHILLLDEKKEYKLDSSGNIENLNIDFDAKYVAPTSQDDERNNGVIGIGTNGKPVDMDLWEYTLYQGTYALNDIEDIDDIDGIKETKGYLGDFVNGEIEGKIPQYIKSSTDKDFIPVTNMKDTFLRCENLEIIPQIPYTITDMQSTFSRCTGIFTVNSLPSSITNMKWTFFNCKQLKEAELPLNVQILYSTFYGCEKLEVISIIPESVTNMQSTFKYCSSLKTAPIIPQSVEILNCTFAYCKNLNGKLIVNATNVSDYEEFLEGACTNAGLLLKVEGKCKILQEIVESANNINITL